MCSGAAARVAWDRPFSGLLGEQYLFTAEVRAAAYNANVLDGQPDYGVTSHSTTAHAQPQVAVKISWPFVRDAGSLGTQTIEPIVQLIAAPQAADAQHDKLPNEDSLAYEFSDATLFSLNRFGGYDRFEGGERANFALHGNWTFLGGQMLDGLVGASAIEHIDQSLYPVFQPYNGFDKGSHLSDIVARAQFVPGKWVDFTARARVDHQNGDLRFADAVAGFGTGPVRFNLGYLYTANEPVPAVRQRPVCGELPVAGEQHLYRVLHAAERGERRGHAEIRPLLDQWRRPPRSRDRADGQRRRPPEV